MAPGSTNTWRLVTIAAFVLTGAFVAVPFVFLKDETLHIQRIALPAGLQKCSTDAECIVVERIGCCPCQSGGARAAITRGQEDGLRRFLKKACRRLGVCVKVNTCQYDLVPACADGRCIARATHG